MDHEHGHNHEHNHEHSAALSITTEEEAKAFLTYMVNHNISHTQELSRLSSKLLDMNNQEAYSEIMAAVSGYEKANAHLFAALRKLGEE